MIIELEEQVGPIELTEQITEVYEFYEFEVPSGMLASLFTAAGQLLASNGAASPVVVPAPTAEAQMLIARLGQTIKMAWEAVDLTQLTQTEVKTAAYTAINNDHVRVDASGAGADFEVALPATPATGNKVRVTMVDEHATYKVTIGRNGSLVNGGTSTTAYSLVNAGDTVYFEYTGATLGWVAVMWNKALDTLTGASANGQSLVTAADYSAMRTLLGLVIGTNVQAWDADLDGWAGKTPPSGNVMGQNESSDTSTATPTPTGNYLRNIYTLSALAVGATFAAPSGTPADGNMILIRVKDNTSSQTVAWNPIYSGYPFTATVAGKWTYLIAVYNSTASKWHLSLAWQET